MQLQEVVSEDKQQDPNFNMVADNAEVHSQQTDDVPDRERSDLMAGSLNDQPYTMENYSVEMLETREGMNYDDMDMGEQQPHKYPTGYQTEDDLNMDGNIDEMEHQIKVIGMKEDIREKVDDEVRREYLAKFRKEVDFHHKVAYRFEKSYRLGKK